MINGGKKANAATRAIMIQATALLFPTYTCLAAEKNAPVMSIEIRTMIQLLYHCILESFWGQAMKMTPKTRPMKPLGILLRCQLVRFAVVDSTGGDIGRGYSGEAVCQPIGLLAYVSQFTHRDWRCIVREEKGSGRLTTKHNLLQCRYSVEARRHG